MSGLPVRSPFVYWAQTENTVSLRVDIRNAQNPKISIEEGKVTFDGLGHGAHGESDYHFELEFPHTINPKASTYRVLDRDIDILIQKEKAGWWEKVVTSHKKPAWLKIDFDRWKSPDDLEDTIAPDVMRDFPNVLDDLKTEEFGYRIEDLRNVYLFLYNLFQFVGNLYIVGVLSIRYMKDGPATFHKAYDLVGFAVTYCQLVQLLEVLHPILGFTKTSVFPAAIQVFGRLTILLGLIASEERIQGKPVVFFLFVIWSMADIIRYPFYMLQISKRNVYVVTWLRYSAWIILYPAGLACEAVIIFGCIPYFVETGRYSVTLPNKLNATFSFPSIMRAYLLFGFIPVAYSLMQNMRRQRAKVLEKQARRQAIKKSQ